MKLTFDLFYFPIQSEAFILEEVELSSKFDDVLVSFDLNINASVGLLRKNEIIAHFLQHIHEGLKEVLLLLVFGLSVDALQLDYLLKNVLMQVGQIVAFNSFMRKSSGFIHK